MREAVERGGEVGDGLVRGVAVERRGRRELVVGERAPLVVAAREVHRELARALAGARAEAGLLAQPDRAMQADAPRLGDALVEHVPVQRVPEAVAAADRSVGPFRDARPRR